MSAAVLGLAHDLPPRQPVGNVQRPIAAEPGGASDLALVPARRALERAGLDIGAVEFIVFATMTADVTFPGSACFFQDKLACGTIGALDIRGQCSGFLLGLMVADGYLTTGRYRNVLLAASEVHSSGLDYSERGLRVASLYGDGAAVVILGRGGAGAGLLSVVCHGDGRHYDRFWCEYPASRQHPVRVTLEDFRHGRHFPSIDFAAVKEFGVGCVPEVVREALVAAGTELGEIDCFILSHVLPDVVEESAERLRIPPNRLIAAGEGYGHLTAASLPVALSEAVEAGCVGAGAKVCLATAGAGFTWGAAVLAL
jgi:3-oxoacyl-[acyl-carrier-protein] synthase III